MIEQKESRFPFILASLHTAWNKQEQSKWRRKASKIMTPIKMTPAQKKAGVDLYSLVVRKRVGWKMDESRGEFARTASGRKIAETKTVLRNRRWDYDIVIYVDGESPTSAGHGIGSRPTYAQLVQQFLNPAGWTASVPNSDKKFHVSPLAPAFGEKAISMLRESLKNDLLDNLDDMANGTGYSPYKSVYHALQRIGSDCVESLRILIEGGIAPKFSRPLSENTIEGWRKSRGITGDKPMNETGELVRHIHWAIVGSEDTKNAFANSRSQTEFDSDVLSRIEMKKMIEEQNRSNREEIVRKRLDHAKELRLERLHSYGDE